MEKNMENEMETGIIEEFIGNINVCYSLNSLTGVI